MSWRLMQGSKHWWTAQLRDGSPPGRRLGVSPADGSAEGASHPPAHPSGSLPAPACVRCAPGFSDPLQKPGGKRLGRGVRRVSCRPFRRATRAFRGAGVGKGDRTPEEVSREPAWVLGEFGGFRLAERRFTPGRRLFVPNPQL